MERKDLFDVVVVRGVDALPFLHSQFAADLNSIGDGQQRWSALLNPQGRVLHVVAVLRLAADEWRLLVPFNRGDELLDLLRRFVFRRKVSMTLAPELHVTPGPPNAIGPVLMLSEAVSDVLVMADLDHFINAGLALIDRGASGRHLAHALRLDRFEAFSVKKGCYPGQEIVARTHFLGRNKRVLVRLDRQDQRPWCSGDVLRDGDAEVGEIVCAGGDHALAVLVLPVATGHVLAAGQDLHPVRVAYSDAPTS